MWSFVSLNIRLRRFVELPLTSNNRRYHRQQTNNLARKRHRHRWRNLRILLKLVKSAHIRNWMPIFLMMQSCKPGMNGFPVLSIYRRNNGNSWITDKQIIRFSYCYVNTYTCVGHANSVAFVVIRWEFHVEIVRRGSNGLRFCRSAMWQKEGTGRIRSIINLKQSIIQLAYILYRYNLRIEMTKYLHGMVCCSIELIEG